MNFFSFFGTSRSYLGVDIGTTSIKVVELSRVGEKIRLENYGILETTGAFESASGALQTSSFRLLEPEVSRHVRTLLKRMGSHAREAIASLPAFAAFTTLVELPKMSAEDVARTIPFQSAQYIPAPLSTVSIEWIPIGERVTSEGVAMQQIFLSSIPNELIEKHTAVFKNAGLHLRALEVENQSLARILSYDSDETTLILDIGARSSSITIAAGGFTRYVSQTDFAGASLTQVLAQGLDIAPRRAEELKYTRGLLGAGGEQELSTLLEPILGVILNEASRAKQGYERSYGARVSRVILSGGSARLLGLRAYVEQALGLPTKIASPFEAISFPSSLRPLTAELGPLLAVAFGLGLRNV